MEDEYIKSLVAKHLPGARLRGSEKMKGGVSASVKLLEVQLFTGEAAKLVFREHGASHCGHPAHLEFHLLQALNELGLAVPKPVAWGNANDFNRHPYILLHYLEGSTDIPASAAEKRIPMMAAELVIVHDAAIHSLPMLPLRADPRPELLHFLPDEAEWQGLRSLLTRMGSTVFGGKPVLVHGDYWPQNIVWRNDILGGILDWEDAALGDPVSDVACACLELSYLYGDWGSQLFLDAYREHRPVDRVRLALWQAYVAAAANCSMANWGLEPDRELLMRQVATKSIRGAARALGVSS